MQFTDDQIRRMADAIDLSIPEDELPAVALRLSCFMTAMEKITDELGDRLETVDPIPPVYPREDF